MLKRFVVIIFVIALATFAFAQKNKAPPEKNINGVVSDAAGNPVPGAVVQLKNLKTLQIRSFIARDKGEYIFQGLAADVDWELKAMANGKMSKARTVSSFDTHAELTVNLQLLE
jgi:hypothetical protein